MLESCRSKQLPVYILIRGSRSVPIGDFSSTHPANSRVPISAFLCLGFRHLKGACVQGKALERVATITSLRVKYRVTRMRDRTHIRFVRRNFSRNIFSYLTYCSTWVRVHSCVKRAECSSTRDSRFLPTQRLFTMLSMYRAQQTSAT